MKAKTLAVQAGYNKDSNGTMSVPIYQTTAFDFGSAETAANRFALTEFGPIYTRLNNPTTDIFEARIAALEEGAAAVAVASGQAASFYAIANVAESGDNIIVSKKVYGGTTSLFAHTVKRFGIETRFFDSDSASELEALIDDKTKAIFFETLSNPQIAIPNIEKIVEIAKKYNIITIADNTVATPVIFKPILHGADIVVHSASKYINGNGTAIGGVIVERENIVDILKNNPRYSHFSEPDESYHGLVYTKLALPIFTLRVRLSLIRDIGAVISPFNSWLMIQGLETLHVRMKEHSLSALKVAKFLQSHKSVKSVNYPGLEGDAGYERAQKYFYKGFSSGLISFEVESFEKAKQVLNDVKIFSIVVNIGDSKSVITHSASTTHQQTPVDELIEQGVNPSLIRLSVGLEDADDLIEDLKQALEKR